MSKTWSSANTKEFKQASKLQPNHIYEITNVKLIKTKFRYKNILIDDSGSEYWPNRKVENFLLENRSIYKFTLITSYEKQFEDKNKNIIKYFDVDIKYD